MSPKKLKADIGVITVIPRELEYALKALELPPSSSRQKVRSGRIYYVGDVPQAFGQPYRVALTCIGEAGTSECAATTSALIHECHPRIVLLVGIAAGMKKGTKIGTVIL